MYLVLKRKWWTDTSTIGELYVDGKFECFTLEDADREGPDGHHKIYGKTAIPGGEYRITLERSPTFTPRYGTKMPYLHDVPNYTGVLIHRGNTDLDTKGCILVGQTRGKDFIGKSKPAFERLLEKIKAAIGKGEPVSIKVTYDDSLQDHEAVPR